MNKLSPAAPVRQRAVVALALTAGLVMAAPALSATAASAGPTLPAGAALYMLDCEDAGTAIWQYDPATGVASIVDDDPTSTSTCSYNGAYDPVSGRVYHQENDQLRWFDPETFERGVTAITGVTDAAALAIDDEGNAVVFTGPWSSPQTVAPLDLTDGTAGTPVPLSAEVNTRAVSYNPVDGLLYSFQEQLVEGGLVTEIVTIDPTTGTVTETGIIVDTASLQYQPGEDTFDAQTMTIDANGMMWVRDDGASVDADNLNDDRVDIVTVDPRTGDSWLQVWGAADASNQTVYDVGYHFYAWGLIVVPGPEADDSNGGSGGGRDELAATGGADLSGVIGLTLLLMAGGALLHRRRVAA